MSRAAVVENRASRSATIAFQRVSPTLPARAPAEQQSPRQRATDQEIQKWNSRQHGFVPQTAWIAHCKELFGSPRLARHPTKIKYVPARKGCADQASIPTFGLDRSVSSAGELQGLQKGDEGLFLLGREIQPKTVPLDRARPTVVALEARGYVVIAKAGRIEPVLECSD